MNPTKKQSDRTSQSGSMSDEVFNRWVSAARSEYPIWFEPVLNPNFSADEAFNHTVIEVAGVVGSQDQALAVINHLLKVWPGGLLSYNASYALHKAQSMNMLDEDYRPIRGAAVVNESDRRMDELRDLGGDEAVRTYNSIMGF